MIPNLKYHPVPEPEPEEKSCKIFRPYPAPKNINREDLERRRQEIAEVDNRELDSLQEQMLHRIEQNADQVGKFRLVWNDRADRYELLGEPYLTEVRERYGKALAESIRRYANRRRELRQYNPESRATGG